MKPTPEIIQVSIVLVGKFIPSVITPAWLAFHEIIGKEEAKKGKNVISHEEISQFNLDWVNVLVLPDKIQIQTLQSPYLNICDFAKNLLSLLLAASPVIQVGINLEHTYIMDFDRLDAIGLKLAPRASWGRWGERLINKDKERKNGLINITMRQGDNLDDREDGNINVHVGPSDKVPSGLRVFVNDHYQLGDFDNINNSVAAFKLLTNNFISSLERSSEIIAGIVEEGVK